MKYRIIMRKFLCLIAFGISLIAYSQNYSSKFISVNEIRSYFAANIGKLDPIEGEYNVKCVTTTGSPFVPKYENFFEEFIIKNPNTNEFTVYSYENTFKISENLKLRPVLGDTESYELYYRNSKGRGNLVDNQIFNVSIQLTKKDAQYAMDNPQFAAWVNFTYYFEKKYPTPIMYAESMKKAIEEMKPDKWSGTGFFLTTDGFIVTNHHVIEDAKTIKITCVNGDKTTQYRARVEVSDKQNDLAILKITDAFHAISNIPYTLKFTQSSIGEDCWVLGYPLVTTMGDDIKLTNGVISSKSGFEGNISQYQFSAPVQPGNSGGPVFDEKGNVIGIVQAKHGLADNAGYAVKTSYLRNLMDMLSNPILLPNTNKLANKTLPQQVELASNCVCLILCE